ncbi:MAG TPA: flagellar hook-basal body complex protein FliE [Candidatus Sulfotelmatobacter sp.]|nr:flagellar hook-basal body complex protein FliE [Candidatus Sulfotelmatobacter sp.]
MDYASAISKVIPGTFAPDMGTTSKVDETPNVSAIPGGPAATGSSDGASFKDTLSKMISDVNDKLNTSDAASRDLATGKTNDLQGVVSKVEEANLAANYLLSVRSKLITAYNTISQMQV